MEYDKLDLIDAKAERLLQKFNSDKDIIMFNNALYILIVLFVITVCFLYVFEGYTYLIFTLALLSLVPYRTIISRASVRSESLSMYNTMDSNDKVSYTIAKLKYLGSMIKLIRARLIALRLVYMVCFPVFIYMLSLILLRREIDWSQEWFYIVLAILIAIPYWFFFFKSEIDELTMNKDEIKNIIVTLQLEP